MQRAEAAAPESRGPTPEPAPGSTSLWQSLRRDLDQADRQGAPAPAPATEAEAGHVAPRSISGTADGIAFADLRRSSSIGPRLAELRGRNVLLATRDQLAAGLALIELDGIARRIVLYPPDVPAEHLAEIAERAEVDAVVVDRADPSSAKPLLLARVALQVEAGPPLASMAPGQLDRRASEVTEWVLLTSGTTGAPKLVAHTLASLAGPVAGAPVARDRPQDRPVWSTFYDIRRYGGLQIFLRGVLGGGSLVLSSPGEPVAAFLARASQAGVTHISGTPSHWRRALMCPAIAAFKPGYVRLSGEIADQAILDALRHAFPTSGVSHAFASTEAGVAFDVADGRSGFPVSLIGTQTSGVELRIVDGTLHIRSSRTGTRYLGADAPVLRAADGFVDTGDVIDVRGDRCHFAGRRGGIINVGGQKIHPEEVEAVINRHPGVRMSLVYARRSPITGAIVAADVVADAGADLPAADAARLKAEVQQACRDALPAHKVPATIRLVPELAVGAAGKLDRKLDRAATAVRTAPAGPDPVRNPSESAR